MVVGEHFDDFYEACCMCQMGNKLGFVFIDALRRNLIPENL